MDTARTGEGTETDNEVNDLVIALGSPEDQPKVDVIKHQTTNNNKERKQAGGHKLSRETSISIFLW